MILFLLADCPVKNALEETRVEARRLVRRFLPWSRWEMTVA